LIEQFLNHLDNNRNRFVWQRIKIILLKKSHRTKRFFANAQAAHLLLAATAQAHPKPKAKEPLLQRFIEFTIC
jgi:hypothetical protein